MDTLKQLFENAGLPTDFTNKASTLFEASMNEAVEARVRQEVKAIQEAAEDNLEKEKAAWIKESEEDLEKFLEQKVNEWAIANTTALAGSIKTGLAESILAKFKSVLESEGVEMPKEKEDALKEAEDKEEALKEAISDLEDKLEESNKRIVAFTKSSIVAEATKSLSKVTASRVKSLAENISFKNVRQYAGAVASITEGVSGKKLKLKEEVADLFPATKDNSDAAGSEKDQAAADGNTPRSPVKVVDVKEDAAGPAAADKYPATNDNSNAAGADKNKAGVEPNTAVTEDSDNKFFDDDEEDKKPVKEAVDEPTLIVKDKVDNTDNPEGKTNNVNEAFNVVALTLKSLRG